MNRDECLKKLEEACKKLESIGNVVEFKQNNPDALFGIIQPVVQYYNYIQTNFKDDEFAILDSMATVLEVGENNPSLKGVVDSITGIDKNKTQAQEFDKTSFVNKTTAIVNEFRVQNAIDTNTIGDFQFALKQCMELLNANRSFFTQEEYQQLADMISNELGKIARFNQFCENNPDGLKM
ncbi:MAG: hypothetical protein IJO33_03060 [Bacilli bacterium]|nr:hypothetical protein [Bacilli bacterium]